MSYNYVTDSLSTGVVAVITAVICCLVSVVTTAIITFVISAHYYKRKYSNKQTAVTQPIVSGTGVIEYEEITKTSPDNIAMILHMAIMLRRLIKHQITIRN